MPHKFDPSMAHILEDEERRKFLPPEKILKEVGVREGVVMADVGCGTGYFTLPAAKLVKDGRVFAVDVQEEMLELLKQRAEGLENLMPVKSEEDAIPLPDESVDIVFMGDVLHELEGDATLREVHRILRRRGVLGIVEWRKEDTGIGPPVEDRLSEQEAVRMLEGVGFAVERCFQVHPYHYCIVARKP